MKQLTVREKRIVARAMNYEMDAVLARHMHANGCSLEEARDHERELKRFLALCAIDAGKTGYGINNPIDKLWHEFILCTKDYAKFCKEVGGKFIHHYPRMPGRVGRKEKADAVRMHGRFLKDYERVFGERAPTRFWTARIDM